ncbi:hypothetical protein GJ496_009367 [Pomphorhynchus laevis]|nr:hypothetical protein GJ496_009367 [Pomphorhynchus laevis]
MTSFTLRREFLKFMVKNKHVEFPSVSVIPSGYDPPGTYFVNSGVFQFRELISKRNENKQINYPTRITNCQKCIRVGGSDCDLKLIGADNIHHTFFEMLGSWSLGSYDIDLSLELALEFLLNEIGLDKDKIHATFFKGNSEMTEDLQAFTVLNKLNFKHIKGKSDNIWTLGKTGPSGTCVELYYPLCSGELVELWNIVKIQSAGKSNVTNTDIRLQDVSGIPFIIDTGLGLERLCAIVQGKSSTYDTDLFVPIKSRLKETIEYYCKNHQCDRHPQATYLNIIADHVRTVIISISDQLRPDSIGIGGIIRKMIEKCLDIAAENWNVNSAFLHKLTEEVSLSLPYQNLKDPEIKRTIRIAEQRYLEKRRKTKSVVQHYIHEHNKISLHQTDINEILSIMKSSTFSLSAFKHACKENGIQFDVQWTESSPSLHDDSVVDHRLPIRVYDIIKKAVESVDCALLVQAKGNKDSVTAKVVKLLPFSNSELDLIQTKLDDGIFISVDPSKDGMHIMKFAFNEEMNNAIKKGSQLRDLWHQKNTIDAWEKLCRWRIIADALSSEHVAWSQREISQFKKEQPSEHSAKRAISNRLRLEQTLENEDVPAHILIGALNFLKYNEPKEFKIKNGTIVLYPKSKKEIPKMENAVWLTDRIAFVETN